MFFADGAPVAGCMPKMPGVPSTEGPGTWGVYLSSADAKDTADKAVAHGRLAAAADPAGAPFKLVG